MNKVRHATREQRSGSNVSKCTNVKRRDKDNEFHRRIIPDKTVACVHQPILYFRKQLILFLICHCCYHNLLLEHHFVYYQHNGVMGLISYALFSFEITLIPSPDTMFSSTIRSNRIRAKLLSHVQFAIYSADFGVNTYLPCTLRDPFNSPSSKRGKLVCFYPLQNDRLDF